MKRIFTILTAFMAAALAMATDYTENLVVTINGASSPAQQATIVVDEATDGTYTLSLKNFKLGMGEDVIGVGTITIDNLKKHESKGSVLLKEQRVIAIQEGDDGDIYPLLDLLQAVPIDMTARLSDGRLNAIINIDMTNTLGQVIKVTLGSDVYQIPNSGFEAFHTATYKDATSDEPNAWHSFMSSTGSMAYLVSSTPHTFISTDELRPGTIGTSCVKVTSGIVKLFFGAIKQPANGTLTTGQLKAGSADATNADNCSVLDMSVTDTDGNGDPFYARLDAQPDAISFWAKFKQGTIEEKNQEYKYATMSAVITDGTYYQDPENTDYTNVVAKAQNSTIESKDFAWQNISVPFDYDTYTDNNVATKAILVTFSTNAQPGVASTDENNPDVLYLDDLELVYNHNLTSLSIGGNEVEGFDSNTTDYSVTLETAITEADIEGVADGKAAYILKDINNVEGSLDQDIVVTVVSGDLEKATAYTVHAKVTTGIEEVQGSSNAATEAVYNINGQRVNDMQRGQVYVVKKSDGTVYKAVRK